MERLGVFVFREFLARISFGEMLVQGGEWDLGFVNLWCVIYRFVPFSVGFVVGLYNPLFCCVVGLPAAVTNTLIFLHSFMCSKWPSPG